MKTTTKIIFGAALSAFSLAALSPQAWAADRITPNANFTIQANSDDSNRISVDHNFHKFNMDFQLPNGVKSGDYFEIETHALPFLVTSQDILSGNDKVKIGEMVEIHTTPGARDRQLSRTADFDSLSPEDSQKKLYKVIFNEQVERRQDISFSIGGSNGYIGGAVVNREYQVESWVKINDEKKASRYFTVPEWPKYYGSNHYDYFRTELDLRNNPETIFFMAGIGSVKDQVLGGVYDLHIDNPYYKFADDQSLMGHSGSGSFLYDDSSYVNPNGVILYEGRIANFDMINKDSGNISLKLKDQSHDIRAGGVGHIRLELTDEGKKFVAENGKMPAVAMNFKITDRDGKVIQDRSQSGEVVVIGETLEFLSKIKEEVKENDKQNPEDKIEDKIEEKTPEIQAPNTGFSGGISALALSAFSLLGIATFFARKR